MIGHEVETIAEIMMVSKDYVYQTALCFREDGLLGLEDKRYYNGRHQKRTNKDVMEPKKLSKNSDIPNNATASEIFEIIRTTFPQNVTP